MRVHFFEKITAALIALFVCGVAWNKPLFAGSPETNLTDKPTSASAKEGNAPHLNIVDHKLALCLAVDLTAQLEMSEQALKETKSESIHQLISTNLSQQRQLAERLELLTGGRTKAAIQRALHEIKNHTPPPTGLAAIRQDATAAVVRIRLEIAQENGRLLHDQMRAKGDGYDRAYLQAEIIGQTQYIATLLVFARQASDDFTPLIEAATAQAQCHLAAARLLVAEPQANQLASPSR